MTRQDITPRRDHQAAPSRPAGPARVAREFRLRRTVVVTLILSGVAVLLAVVALGLGKYPLTPIEVLEAVFVPDGGFATTVVLEWRAPRVVAALVFGAALAVSGALFQSLTRNPLGSPDVIGFSTGAYTGAVIVIIAGAGTFVGTALGALAGGLLTAILVYALARRGGVSSFRLIVVGIGVTAFLHALNTWMLLRAQTEVAMTASIWGAGSLALAQWSQLVPAAVILILLVPAVALLAGPLRQLELGDETARSHGVRVEPTRFAVLIVGVMLTAVVTAATGPIAFVALSAPQLALRLERGPGVPILSSAVLGGVLLLAADLVAQHALGGAVPVGVVTIVMGGAYLVVLLALQARR
ncbi:MULTISPECIES: FecCD family ABC transporter permease [unclassified Pseudoclavibacter]|uniref:FecCD family ABC transporter permease n=1 Tax=unclassified Pseudoclavibacter TaxID=2615177 RepID=UPI000CE7E00A|nr:MULTISPECIES: iron chelate uptake ABC transporter family permease subunit [unclassified Pseudoclavibacter]MBS3177392.1 iron chelate uptake ABC transporter family permease subunit [Pseudoclavibacter sp. Marseille-Q4354]PPG29869.1 iron-enterobactin ABC transporter permease [Pseudoclavibacter sp. RFBB5]